MISFQIYRDNARSGNCLEPLYSFHGFARCVIIRRCDIVEDTHNLLLYTATQYLVMASLGLIGLRNQNSNFCKQQVRRPDFERSPLVCYSSSMVSRQCTGRPDCSRSQLRTSRQYLYSHCKARLYTRILSTNSRMRMVNPTHYSKYERNLR